MFEPENPFRVLYGSVGNNKHNDYDDVTNAKHKLQRLGYYKDTVDNGYIDEPLRQSIQSYQRDNDLSVDGFMNPGGETETHMYGDLLGLPKSTMRYDEGNFKSAAAPAIPAIFGVLKGARAAKKVWDIWKSVPPADRQEKLKESCYRAYDLECDRCRMLSKQGKEKESALKGRDIQITSYASPTVVDGTLIDDLDNTDATTDWQEQSFSSLRGWPVSVAFHQDRLVIGGSRDLPNRLWFSKSGDIWNFDLGDGLDDESIEFAILSDQVNAIRAVFSGRHLQVFTSGAE